MQLYIIRRRLVSYIYHLFFIVYEQFLVLLKSLFPDYFFFSINDCEKSLRHHFLFNMEDVDQILRILKNKPDYVTNLIDEADKLIAHNFYFLGIKKQIEGKICWNEDISTGFKWPNLYYKYCNTIYENRSDIIMVWELSRFQHLFTLCKAYKLTGNQLYFDEVNSQIKNWLQSTTYKIGPNWITAMDVAIRSINWILALSLLYSDANLNKHFKTHLFVSLYLHAKHIRSNLPLRKTNAGQLIGTNHYMASLAGCIYLGTLFKESAFGDDLYNWGFTHFITEIERQVHPEGDNFERATCYHRLVGEIIGSALVLLKLNNEPVPDEVIDRFSKMVDFTVNYTRPDNQVPQIGDTDDGRLYRLGRYFDKKLYSHYHFIELGKVLFNIDSSDYLNHAHEFMEENLWITYRLGKKRGLPIANGFEVNLTPKRIATYPGTGFHIFRNNQDFLLAIAGNVGSSGLGNHTHNDNLSFELCYKGFPVIVDPGCYTYTSDLSLRQLYRSTSMHNSLQIDDYEINHISRDNIFRMEENAFPKVIEFSDDGNLLWHGLHFGFCRSHPRVIHKRKIYYFYQDAAPYFIFEDRIIPVADHPNNDLPECYLTYRNEDNAKCTYNARLSFHFSPFVHLSPLDKSTSICFRDLDRGIIKGNQNCDDNHHAFFGYQIECKKFNMALVAFSNSNSLEGGIEDYNMAESYRKKVKAKKVVLEKSCTGPTSITTYIGPIII